MADKRGTEETKQAAREARRKREKRKKYDALLEEHPAVKAVRARMVPRAERGPLKRGVPKLIAEATKDRDVDTAVTAMRRIMNYHHRTGDLARRRLRRETIPLKEQKTFMQQGENIESDFREMLRAACRASRTNPATEAYAAAIAARPDDIEVLDNLPSFLSRSELAAIKYLGVDPQEMSEAWDQLYAPHRQEVRELLASGKINQALERVEKYAERLDFPEAPRHLIKRGVITLGGDAAAAPIVVAAATAVAAVVIAPIAPVAALILIVVVLVSIPVIMPAHEKEEPAPVPASHIWENGFKIGVHDYRFKNFDVGKPSWGTFEDTFGALEVWHELLDPIFGHPYLTPVFYGIYYYFLLGEGAGGLATGFCTALASTGLNRFWLGYNDTHTAVSLDESLREQLTAVHGRMLSREFLLTMHDQGRQGTARVTTTFRAIESDFASGGTRETAPLLFFIPSGEVWDAGYLKVLANKSHCIVPVKIIYPTGSDGSDLDGIKLYCWDNNHPCDHNCWVEFRRTDGEICFDYYASGLLDCCSEDGITLGTMNLDEYLLRDVDMPFSGLLGKTTFIIDFLLSPATLRIEDGEGRVTGQVGGQILAEIPDSHPAYLIKDLYLLPPDTELTRTITGTARGIYEFHSLSAAGTSSVSLSNAATDVGQTDKLAITADGNRIRFTPGATKTLDITLGRIVNGQARGLSIIGAQGAPTADLDMTVNSDLSLVKLANKVNPVTVELKLMGLNLTNRARTDRTRTGISIPANHGLTISVTDWDNRVVLNVIETTLPAKTGSDVRVTDIFYNGLVPRVESDEYVEITNIGDEPQDLDGWVLKDVDEGYPSFTFPSYVLAPGESVRVYTNEIHPRWGGFSFGYGRAIWNNRVPDTAALYNAEGQEVSRRSYEV